MPAAGWFFLHQGTTAGCSLAAATERAVVALSHMINGREPLKVREIFLKVGRNMAFLRTYICTMRTEHARQGIDHK